MIDCHGGSHDSLFLANQDGLTIENCTFDNAVVQVGSSQNITLLNNTFTSTDGTAHNSGQIVVDDSMNVTVSGNRLDGAGVYDDGIIFQNSTATATGNTAQNYYDCGLELIADVNDSTFTGNTFDGQSCGFGCFVWCSMQRDVVDNNTVSGPLFGFRLENDYGAWSGDSVMFTDNRVNGNVATAPYERFEGCENLTVERTPQGVTIDPPDDTFTVSNNDASGNTWSTPPAGWCAGWNGLP